MAGPNDERDLRRTRTAYVGAAQRLLRAMQRLRETAPPLLPERRDDQGLPAWSAVQAEAMQACADSFTEVVRLHQSFGRLARRLPPH